ncbi:MAG: hypothetical protein LBR19_09390 [Bifidobacteriaceae bacterium]|jgi:hypothetical protein|nr:hypothetical protein [Bifidobacteriaceae bacterium]
MTRQIKPGKAWRRRLARVAALAGAVFAGLWLAAVPAQADWDDYDFDPDSGSGGIGMYIGFVGVAGIAAGPVLYATVTKRYSLTDKDDAKDQAIRSQVALQNSGQASGLFGRVDVPRPAKDTLVVTYRKGKGASGREAKQVSLRYGGNGRPGSGSLGSLGDLFGN